MSLKAGTIYFKFKGNTTHLKNSISNIKTTIGNLGSVFKKLEIVGAAAFAGIALAARKAFKTTAEFDAAMRRLAVVTGASATEMARLEESALKFAATSGRPLKEITDSYLRIAQAGFHAASAIEMATKESLKLSISGQITADEAGDLLTSLMRGYGMQANELGKASDVLTSVFMNTKATVADLAEGFKFAGPIARQMGMSFEQTAVLLGILSDNLIRAGLGGRQMRASQISLLAPTMQTIKLLEKYGISLRDHATLKTRDFVDVVEEMKEKMSSADFSRAFTRLSMSAALIFGESGDRYLDLLEKIKRDQGKAAEAMKAHLGSIAGQWEQLTATIETAGAAIGKSHNPALLRAVEIGKELVITVRNLVLEHTAAIVSFVIGVLKVWALVKALAILGAVFKFITPLAGIAADAIILAFKNPAIALKIGLVGAAVWGIAKAYEKLTELSNDPNSWVSKLGEAYDKLKEIAAAMGEGFLEFLGKGADQRKLEETLDRYLAARERLTKPVPPLPEAAKGKTPTDAVADETKKAAKDAEKTWFESLEKVFDYGVDLFEKLAPETAGSIAEEAEKIKKAIAAAYATARREAKLTIEDIGEEALPLPEMFMIGEPGIIEPSKRAQTSLGIITPEELKKRREAHAAAVKEFWEDITAAFQSAGFPTSLGQFIGSIIKSSTVIQDLGKSFQEIIGILGKVTDALFAWVADLPRPAQMAIAGGIGGAMVGAGAGSLLGIAGATPYGAAIGAGVGLAVGLLSTKSSAEELAKAQERQKKIVDMLTGSIESLISKLVEEITTFESTVVQHLGFRARTGNAAVPTTQAPQLPFGIQPQYQAEHQRRFEQAQEEVIAQWKIEEEELLDSVNKFISALDADQLVDIKEQFESGLRDAQMQLALSNAGLLELTQAQKDGIGGQIVLFTEGLKQLNEALKNNRIYQANLAIGTSPGESFTKMLDDVFASAFTTTTSFIDPAIRNAELWGPYGQPLPSSTVGHTTARIDTTQLQAGIAEFVAALNPDELSAAQEEVSARMRNLAFSLDLGGMSDTVRAEQEARLAFLTEVYDQLAQAAKEVTKSFEELAGMSSAQVIDDWAKRTFGPGSELSRSGMSRELGPAIQVLSEEQRKALLQSVTDAAEALRLQLQLTPMDEETRAAVREQLATYEWVISVLEAMGVSLEEVTDAMETAAGEILNIPSGYKIDLARYRATVGETGPLGTGTTTPTPEETAEAIVGSAAPTTPAADLTQGFGLLQEGIGYVIRAFADLDKQTRLTRGGMYTLEWDAKRAAKALNTLGLMVPTP